MSNSEEKSSNGLGSDPLQRLASFKAPRDLSLGGVKPNKKVFVPNLNVARNKTKGYVEVFNYLCPAESFINKFTCLLFITYSLKNFSFL